MNVKERRGAFIGITVIFLIVLSLFAVYLYEKSKDREYLAKLVFSLGSDSPGNSVEELKASIAAYERRIEKHVRDAAKTGNYWKILAVRLQGRGLHGEALEALERGIYYTPADPALHYYTGVSAGIIAKSVHQFPGSGRGERESYFTLAEDAYLRAIELDDRYLRPRYGLAVLYVFELDRPEDAVPLLERCLEISRNDVDTMFVLARAFFMLEKYRAAVEVYDRIITLTRDSQKRIDAQNNRQQAMERIYG
jgi:tetratricopeptide (TPR) repeat protein